MSESEKDELEDQLAQMTRWEGESTDLWQKAMNAHETQEPTSRFWSATLLHRRNPAIAAVITIVGGLVIASALILPYISDGGVMRRSGQSLSNLRSLATSADSYAGRWQASGARNTPPGPPDASVTAPGYASLIEGGGGGFGMGSGPGRRITVEGDVSFSDLEVIAGITGDTSSEPRNPADRQVIRKATIELLTNDVRATFLKATQLLSEARSEYLEA